MSTLRCVGAFGILAGEADFQEKCGSGGLPSEAHKPIGEGGPFFCFSRGDPPGIFFGPQRKEKYSCF